MEILVSADRLQDMREKGEAQILDATYFLPQHGRDAWMEYAKGHLPGAVFLDFELVSDRKSRLPMTLLSPSEFAEHLAALGIDRDRPIVVYDDSPLHSSGRAWWLLKTFGAPDVGILDGGKAAWVAAGGALETGEARYFKGNFPAVEGISGVVGLADMRGVVRDQKAQVLDARSPGRFHGTEPEVRANMRSGHMPGAINIPNGSLFAEDGRFHDRETLARVFADAGVDIHAPVITTCGSGVTAANIVCALALLGVDGAGLYDGSWAEWGGRYDTEVVRAGPAESGKA